MSSKKRPRRRKAKATALMAGAASATGLAVAAIPAADAQSTIPPLAAAAGWHKTSAGWSWRPAIHAPGIAGSQRHITWQDLLDNRYLQVFDSGKASNDVLQTYPAKNDNNQKWYVNITAEHSKSGADLYSFENVNSFLCMSTEGGAGNRKPIVQRSCATADSWEQLSIKSHNHFLGYALVADVAGTSPDQGIVACDNTGGNHKLYSVPAISQFHYSTPAHWEYCIWH